MTSLHVVLADDHDLIRQHLRDMLADIPEYEVVAEMADGLDLLRYVQTRETPPDVILMDITMPGLRGIEATRMIKSLHPGIKVLIVTVHREREYLQAALSAGADGYLLKDAADAELLPAMAALRGGATYVSGSF